MIDSTNSLIWARSNPIHRVEVYKPTHQFQGKKYQHNRVQIKPHYCKY